MAQERARSNQHVQHQRRLRPTADTHEDEEEVIHEEPVSLPYRKAYDMAEKFATTRIGQFVIVRGDRLLKIIETTAKWSLPQDQMEDKLQRPLPWIPFLMIIVALRLTRVWVSIGSMMIGNAPIKAQDVVYFIQTRRRKLRALRLRGIKEIYRRETEMNAKKPGHGQNTLVAQMKRFFSIAICRPGQHREPERRMMMHRGKEIICIDSENSEQQVSKRPRNDECEADMTLNELLNKYVNENTEDDSDFVPNQGEDDTGDNSATSSETSESVDDGEPYVQETSSETKNHQSEKRRHRYPKDSDTSLNNSFELKKNGNGEMMTVPKPMLDIKPKITSDTEPSEKVKTPQENGPSNGSENREVDVAFKFVLTPPGIENVHEKRITSVTDVENSYKSTPGHMSAAQMILPLSSIIHATGTAAPERIKSIDLTTTDTSTDAVDNTSRDNDKEIASNISNPDSSPTLSGASSSTSIDSLIDNEKARSDTRAKTSIKTPINKETDLDSAAVASVSSSEDDFYSPIGSPPDFNVFQEAQMNFNFSNSGITHPQLNEHTIQKTVSEPHISEIPKETAFTQGFSAPSGRRNQYQSSHQGNRQHRYRRSDRR